MGIKYTDPDISTSKQLATDFDERLQVVENVKIDYEKDLAEVTTQLAETTQDMEILYRNGISIITTGAKLDGITDDTQAIIDAISSLNEGQALIIPYGNCYIGTDTVINLPSNCELLCYGKFIIPNTRTNVLFNILNKENIVISGLKVDGGAISTTPYSDSCHVLMIKSGRNIKIRDFDIRNVIGDGIYIGRDYSLTTPIVHSENIEVTNGVIHNAKRQSVAVVDGINIKVRFNKLTSDYGTGNWNISGILDIEPNNTNEAIKDVYFEWNYIDGTAGQDGKSILLGTSIGSGKTPSQFRDVYFRYNTLVCRTNPTIALLFDGGNGCINGVCEGNKILGVCETGIQAYKFLRRLNVKENEIESSSVNGIIFSYNGSDVKINNNDITITSGRGVQSGNNSGSKYTISDNIVKGTTVSAEVVMINGNNYAVSDVSISNNKVSVTGSTYGLRTYQCDKVKLIGNDAEKITTTSNTNLARSLNTINGQFPKQSGTTAERPTSVDDNHIYYDTTLAKPIIYNGGWKDFLGVTV